MTAVTYTPTRRADAHAASRSRAGQAKKEARRDPRPHWLHMNYDDFVRWLEQREAERGIVWKNKP